MGRFVVPVTGEWVLAAIRHLHPDAEIPEDARVIGASADTICSVIGIVCESNNEWSQWREGARPPSCPSLFAITSDHVRTKKARDE